MKFQSAKRIALPILLLFGTVFLAVQTLPVQYDKEIDQNLAPLDLQNKHSQQGPQLDEPKDTDTPKARWSKNVEWTENSVLLEVSHMEADTWQAIKVWSPKTGFVDFFSGSKRQKVHFLEPHYVVASLDGITEQLDLSTGKAEIVAPYEILPDYLRSSYISNDLKYFVGKSQNDNSISVYNHKTRDQKEHVLDMYAYYVTQASGDGSWLRLYEICYCDAPGEVFDRNFFNLERGELIDLSKDEESKIFGEKAGSNISINYENSESFYGDNGHLYQNKLPPVSLHWKGEFVARSEDRFFDWAVESFDGSMLVYKSRVVDYKGDTIQTEYHVMGNDISTPKKLKSFYGSPHGQNSVQWLSNNYLFIHGDIYDGKTGLLHNTGYESVRPVTNLRQRQY